MDYRSAYPASLLNGWYGKLEDKHRQKLEARIGLLCRTINCYQLTLRLTEGMSSWGAAGLTFTRAEVIEGMREARIELAHALREYCDGC